MFPFVLRHCLSLVSKMPRFLEESFCPVMERKLCDVCISSLSLLWHKFIVLFGETRYLHIQAGGDGDIWYSEIMVNLFQSTRIKYHIQSIKITHKVST